VFFRLNDINYSIVQGYVLIRLYQAALMVAAGVKPAEPYAIMSFITMVGDIIESPLHNADGSGSMLMIRIPNKHLSKHFQNVLLKTRNRYVVFCFKTKLMGYKTILYLQFLIKKV